LVEIYLVSLLNVQYVLVFLSKLKECSFVNNRVENSNERNCDNFIMTFMMKTYLSLPSEQIAVKLLPNARVILVERSLCQTGVLPLQLAAIACAYKNLSPDVNRFVDYKNIGIVVRI